MQPEKYASATANLAAFASIESEKVGFLLGHLLQRKYPDIEKGVNISLKDLLTWSHWPNFIKIYSKEIYISDVYSCLNSLYSKNGIQF